MRRPASAGKPIEIATELAPRLRDFLREALREPALDFADRPTRVTGGFDTQIFAFRLSGAPPAFAGPLILRMLARHHDPARAVREQAAQNALVELGYPAPRVLLASADPQTLGGAFLVMERLAGKPLPEVHLLGMARIVAELQARLHDLDADAFLRALAREGLSPQSFTFVAHLEQLASRVAGFSLGGLATGIEWLGQRRPVAGGPRAICHGDFHPYNILMAADRVTGVLDWPHAVVADPEFDVATTLIILKLVPMEVSELSPALRWLAKAARPVLVAAYLRGYRRRRALDRGKLAYYEAAACMKALVRAGELRLVTSGAGAPNALFASPFTERALGHFRGLTGITPVLPAAAGSA